VEPARVCVRRLRGSGVRRNALRVVSEGAIRRLHRLRR
jgi:hypothetical protein